MDKVKILVIGLDGLTWDVIEPWLDNLPTFKKLVKNGVCGKIESTIPPWTIPAWESICTGKNPAKLGFSTFMVKDGYRFIPHIFKHKKQMAIWNLLSNVGYRIVIANLPNVYVPEKINGCMVTGWLYLNKDKITYPKDLIKKLNEECGGYMLDIFDVDFERGIIISSPKEDDYIRSCEELLEKHSKAFKYLLQNYNWDFAFIVFVTPDRIQHKYFGKKDILFEHFKKIDEKLKEILNIIDKKTVIFIISDHGFGPVKYTFNVNEFLLKEGYLQVSLKDRIVLFIVKSLKHITKFLDKFKLGRTLKKYIGSMSFDRLNINWNRTKAFGYAVLGDIYLNVKGREPKGFIDESEYYNLCDEIINKIKNLKYKNKKLNIKIFKKNEIYQNANLMDDLPDLIIVPTDDGVQNINPNIGIGEIITEENDVIGNHRLHGIFIAYGYCIKKGYEVKNVKVYDIAPTILYTFDLPIPNDMDGRILVEIFEDIKKDPKYVPPSYYLKKGESERVRSVVRKSLKHLF